MQKKQVALFVLVVALGIWLGSDQMQSRCTGVDSLFSASCSNLYADTEAPESSDSLCRSMCSLFVDAAVPVGWGRACRHQYCCTAGSRALHFRKEQNYNRLFLLIPDVGSKETTHSPTAPNGDIQLGVENPG